MSDEQYVNALVNGHATIEHRSEQALVDEVKRLRTALALTKTNFEEAERLLYLKLHEREDKLDAALTDGDNKDRELERLRAENAELRESLRRIVGHLEYETKQGDGIADGAYDDYFAAKSLLGQRGMPNAAARGLAAIRLEIASTKPGAGT